MASSLLRAVPGTFTWDKLRTSLIPATPSRGSEGSERLGPNGGRGDERACVHPACFELRLSSAHCCRGSVGALQLLHDGVVLRAAHEVVHRDVLGAGRPVLGARREVLVGDDEVDVV